MYLSILYKPPQLYASVNSTHRNQKLQEISDICREELNAETEMLTIVCS